MTDLVERVARSMCRTTLIEFDGARADQATWDRACDFDKAILKHMAQDALSAINDTHVIVPREPTEAMIEAGECADDQCLAESPYYAAAGIYRAMIEAGSSFPTPEPPV